MKNLNKYLVGVALAFASTASAATDYKALKQEYIDQYRTTAIQQMIHTKIPASITLAQGLLESGAGTSRLATKGNNHFGIKCHGWKGDYMFHDDDAKGECFRVYGNAELSFVDHSEFLMYRGRYSFLFGLNTTDYVGWAKGLKKAGYATNPQYANILIKLIQDFDLDDFDATIIQPKNNQALISTPRNKFDGMAKKEANETVYVKSQMDGAQTRISSELNDALAQLGDYNDFKESASNVIGNDKQKGEAKDESLIVIAQQNQTLKTISLDLGIKLKKLEKRNPTIDKDQVLKKGTTVHIR